MKAIRSCARKNALCFDDKPSNDVVWVLIDYLQNQYHTLKTIRDGNERGLCTFWYNLDGILRSRRYGTMITVYKGNYLAGYCCYSKRDAHYNVIADENDINPYAKQLTARERTPDPKVDKVVLEYMEILPSYKREGLGTKLYDYFEKKMLEQGYRYVHLESLDTTREFWIKRGYEFGNDPFALDYLHSCKLLK